MANIDIRFEGYANFSQVQRQVGALQAQFDSLNKTVAKSAYAAPGTVDGQKFAEAQKRMTETQRAFSNALASSGQFEVAQKRLRSHTQDYIRDLQKQRIGMRQAIGDLKEFSRGQGSLNAVYKEQLRLRQLSISTFSTDHAGNPLATISVPKNISADLDTMRTKIGLISQVTHSASTQMVNWGKNTQWAGRQLTVGFTVPLAMAAAGMAKISYDIDHSLTAIAKVYDTQSYDMLNAADAQIAKERELMQVRADSINTAKQAASAWGTSAQTSLDVTAELAAIGKQGADLQSSAMEVIRFSTMGDMEAQQALQTVTTLQSVYALQVKETSDALNYFNAVENETALSMQDIAEALPIAAGPLQNIGVDFKELTMLMVAMKERGVTSATEGANALKSAVGKLYAPTGRVLDMFKEMTGKDLQALRDQSGGDFVTYLKEIGAAVEELSGTERAGLLSRMFGAEQSSRLTSLLNGLMEGTGQVARVMDVMGRTAEENADSAATELERLAQAPSMQLKRAWEEMRLTLGQAGQGFLEFGAMALRGVNSLLDAIMNLPGPVQKVLTFFAGITALAGPMLMLFGLTGNLIGNGMKYASMLGILATKQKFVTTEQAAAQRIAEMTAKSLGYEANETVSLKTQMDALSASIREATASHSELYQQLAKASGMPVEPSAPLSKPSQTTVSRIRRQVGSGTASDPYRSESTILSGQTAITGETEKQKRNMSALITGSSILAATTLMQVGPWSQITGSAGKYLMVLTLAAPVIKAMRSGLAQLPAIWSETLAIARKGDGVHRAQTGRFKSMGTAAMGVARSIGFVNIAMAAAAAGGFLLYRHIKNSAEESKKLHSDVEKLGDIFGFTPREIVPLGEDGSDSIDNRMKKISALREEYKNLDEYITSSMSNEEAFNRAAALGFRAFDAGATAEQAKDVVRTALEAAGADAEAIMLQFEFDPEDLQQRAASAVAQIQAGINEAENSGLIKSALSSLLGSGVGTDATAEAGASIARGLIKDLESGDATTAIENFTNAVEEARSRLYDGGNRMNVELIDSFIEAQASTLGTSVEKLKEEIDAYYEKNNIVSDVGPLRYLNAEAMFAVGGGSYALQQAAEMQAAQQRQIELTQMADEVSKGLNETQRQGIENMVNGTTVTHEQWQSLQSVLNQTKEGLSEFEVTGLTNALTEVETKIKTMRAEQEAGVNVNHLAIAGYEAQANIIRESLYANGELANLANSRLGIEGAINTTLGHQVNMANQAKNAAIEAIIANDELINSMHRQAAGASWGVLETVMMDEIDRVTGTGAYASSGGGGGGGSSRSSGANRAQQREFDKRQKAEKKAFDDRQKAEKEALDNKHKAELDAIEKEDKARQKAADAEERRIERLKARRQSDIDYRVAMAAGNLDAAAKIRNDSQAREQEWALDDSERARKETLEAQKDAIKQRQDAEKEAMQERLDMQREEFEERKQMEREAMQDRQAAASASATKLNRTAARSADVRKNIEKQLMVSQLQALMAYIPADEREKERHLDRMHRVFSAYGIDVKNLYEDYGVQMDRAMRTNFAKSMNQMKTDVAWGQVARETTDKMIRSIFKMDLATFIGKTNWGMGSRHSGGLVGGGNDSRKGYSAGTGKMPSERLLLAKPNEYVLQESAVRALGTDYLDKLNQAGNTDGTGPDDRHKGVGGPVWNKEVGTRQMMAPYLAYVRKTGEEQRKREAAMMANLGAGYGIRVPAGGIGQGGLPASKHADLDYGNRWGRPWQKRYGRSGPNNFHDFPTPVGTPVYAPHDGVAWGVDYPGYEPEPWHKGRGYRSAGRRMFLKVGNDTMSFAHLIQRRFTDPRQVKGGTVLGWTGETGRAFGPHVHMEWNRQYRFEAEMRKRGITGLRRGGKLKYDNTLINAHKGETVLTRRLTNKFSENIENMGGNGSGSSFGDINIHLEGDMRNGNMRQLAMEIRKEFNKEMERYGRQS